MGYPLQQIENFLCAGVKVGLGFYSIALSGNAYMFRTMKMVQDTEKIRNLYAVQDLVAPRAGAGHDLRRTLPRTLTTRSARSLPVSALT